MAPLASPAQSWSPVVLFLSVLNATFWQSFQTARKCIIPATAITQVQSKWPSVNMTWWVTLVSVVTDEFSEPLQITLSLSFDALPWIHQATGSLLTINPQKALWVSLQTLTCNLAWKLHRAWSTMVQAQSLKVPPTFSHSSPTSNLDKFRTVALNSGLEGCFEAI